MATAHYVFFPLHPKYTSNIIWYNYYHSQMSTVTFDLTLKTKYISVAGRKKKELKLLVLSMDCYQGQ